MAVHWVASWGEKMAVDLAVMMVVAKGSQLVEYWVFCLAANSADVWAAC